MNILMLHIAAILLPVVGAVSSNPGAGAEGAPMVPTIQCECDCGIVQSVSTSDTDYGKMGGNDLMNEHIYKETDDTVSEGQSKDGLTYGEGTCKWIDGNVYDGVSLFGKPHGDGKMKYKDGREYDGEMLFGKPHGDGKMKYKDGGEYDGKWCAGERHGKGKMKYNDGREYVGEWAANKMHGKGKYTWPDRGVYVGEFVEGTMHRKGKYTWAKGKEYIGEFAEGKQHGAGTETSMWNVYRYQGRWIYGKRHGKGVLAWFGDFMEWEVEFENGQLVDVFTVKFASLKRLFVEVIILNHLWKHRFGLVYVLIYVCVGFGVGSWVVELVM
eukprot:scaffold648_cov75-Skeletonema_dohrnii-CCMP3373.AAC.2